NNPPVIDLDSSQPGTNYTTTFTENSAGVAIANSDISITDLDDTNIENAVITLTNAQTADNLTLPTFPTGISGTIDTSVAGQITVNLTGSSSLSNYQTAIKGIQFSNNSSNPDLTPRNISVVVNDGENDSNIAQTTINISPINNPPVIDLDSSQPGTNYTTTFTEN
ncbi:hypothetical protein, partial [Planktothrix tepida]|uniref:hypothetical protein n=1 Tax=Planktothrix tepida TaxID=1678309 RepID=UPI0016449515